MSELAGTKTLTDHISQGTDSIFTEDQTYDVVITDRGLSIPNDRTSETFTYHENDSAHMFSINSSEINLKVEKTGPVRRIIVQQGCTDSDMSFRIYYDDKSSFTWELSE